MLCYKIYGRMGCAFFEGHGGGEYLCIFLRDSRKSSRLYDDDVAAAFEFEGSDRLWHLLVPEYTIIDNPL